MTNEEIKQALKLLLKVWEKGGKEAAEALLAGAVKKK